MATWTRLADGNYGIRLSGGEAQFVAGDTISVVSRKGYISNVTLGEMVSKARTTRIFTVEAKTKYNYRNDPDYLSEQRYFGFGRDGDRLNYRNTDPYDPYDN